jgi:hypothetical protein
MARDSYELEAFLNSLEGEVISVLPDVTQGGFNSATVNFVLIIERVDEEWFPRRNQGDKAPEDIVVP